MLIIKQETWYIITTLGWADNIDLNLISHHTIAS